MSFAANPRAPQLHPDDAPRETSGLVTSDSLAAESARTGGGFAENENAELTRAKGASSTLNTTDTSAASTLPPAVDGAAREKNEALSGTSDDVKGTAGLKYPEGAGSVDFPGAHNADGYVGGPRSAQPSSYETAPSYTATVTGDAIPEGQLKPKGDNLTEGDIPKTKTFTGDVGGPHDPGRLAEQGFQKINADTAATVPRQQQENVEEGGSGQFDVLDSSERA